MPAEKRRMRTFPFISFVLLREMGSHIKSTHTRTHRHTKQLRQHGANSLGTEATKKLRFLLEILSLHGETLFVFCIAGRQDDSLFISGFPNEEDGEPRSLWVI